ncbi:MAG TPA: type II toxin-antitoxin system Phd/YefM family antitoxin [Desulfuromonadales bacterium]|nr:type II toxin-antitoxin system Phd/YefM family antitoxin [Desulfuromonadales bacterium]
MMQIYTYTQAEKNLSSVLDCAKKAGEVLVKRQNGELFVIKPQKRKSSPLDVPGIPIGMSAEEIVSFIRESRER